MRVTCLQRKPSGFCSHAASKSYSGLSCLLPFLRPGALINSPDRRMSCHLELNLPYAFHRGLTTYEVKYDGAVSSRVLSEKM